MVIITPGLCHNLGDTLCRTFFSSVYFFWSFKGFVSERKLWGLASWRVFTSATKLWQPLITNFVAVRLSNIMLPYCINTETAIDQNTNKDKTALALKQSAKRATSSCSCITTKGVSAPEESRRHALPTTLETLCICLPAWGDRNRLYLNTEEETCPGSFRNPLPQPLSLCMWLLP